MGAVALRFQGTERPGMPPETLRLRGPFIIEARGVSMRRFTFKVHDDRFDAPFLAYVTCKDEVRAREIAEQKFSDTPHIVLIEVSDGNEQFSIGNGSA